VQEHNDVVAGVDELLCLQAALFPRLEILFLEHLVDLGLTVGYLALLKPADGAVELDLGIDQLCRFPGPLPGTPRRPPAPLPRSPATSPAQYRALWRAGR
jgi:hypothetical protein